MLEPSVRLVMINRIRLNRLQAPTVSEPEGGGKEMTTTTTLLIKKRQQIPGKTVMFTLDYFTAIHPL